MLNMLNMFKKLWLVIGCLSLASAQNPFCSGDLYFIRPDPNSRKSWMDAQEMCKNNSATLPIIENPSRQRNFVDALTYYGLTGEDVWLGARAYYNDSENYWTWLNGSRYNGPVVQERGSYYKSYAFLTNRTNSDKSYAYASPPNASYSYICQCNVTDPSVCKNGTGQTAFVKDSRCFMKYDDNFPWFSARNKCLSNNCDLASFSQLSLLDGMLDSSGSWAGLRASQWSWKNAVTGLAFDVTFTSWRIGQPNDATPTCISTDSSDFPNWRDIDCANSHSYYICQVTDTSSFSVPSTTACTTTTNYGLGTASTSTSTDENKPLSSIPKASTTKTKDAADPGIVNTALAIGLGVGLGVPFIILIVVVIVVVVIVLRRKHRNSAESCNAQSTKKFVANDSEISTDDGTTGTKDKKKTDNARLDNSPVQYATVRETNSTPDLVQPSNQGTVYADLRFSGEGS